MQLWLPPGRTTKSQVGRDGALRLPRAVIGVERTPGIARASCSSFRHLNAVGTTQRAVPTSFARRSPSVVGYKWIIRGDFFVRFVLLLLLTMKVCAGRANFSERGSPEPPSPLNGERE